MVAIADREPAIILVGYTDDQFKQNAVTVIAELRANLAIFDKRAIHVLSLLADSS